MGWFDHRPQSEIQMGNGTLLVTFDQCGEIEQFFTPMIDAHGSRLGSFRTSVLIPHEGSHPELIRIDRENFHIRLQLMPGSQVLKAEYQHKNRPLRILRSIGLHPTEPVLFDQWRMLDDHAGLLHESIPWFGNSTSAHCSLYHPTFNALVHHRGRRWLGVMSRSDTQWVRVGHLNHHDRQRLWSGERLFAPMGAQDLGAYPEGPVKLGWDQVVQGPSTWGAFATMSDAGGETEFMIICANSESHLGELREMMKGTPTSRYFEIIEGMVSRRHQPAAPILEKIKNPKVRALCERSIDVLHALQDGKSGALMAAAEVDPHCEVSGGYGYSWPRDGAYLGLALGAFGFRERVEHYFRFLAETQDSSGAWWQRYLASGHAGPSWGRIQIDEPASVISLAHYHYFRTSDLFWLEKYWPVVRKGLAFLDEFHSKEFPMGLPSHDLWEERMGIHAYSLGAVISAFESGALMARALSDTSAQKHYSAKAKMLRQILEERFVPENGPVRRSFVSGSWQFTRTGEGYWDEAPDASLLGLMTPFRIFDSRKPVARKIVEMVRGQLWSRPQGGVLRYTQDTYRGGNPWVLTTLWLASVELSLGNYTEARECFQWAVSKATSLGMLPEQVHRETGQPYWVIPLGWSHAMFLLFVREVLEKKVQNQIWETFES